MAEVDLLQGKAAQALDLYDRLLAEDEKSPKLWNERGVCLHQTGDVDGAEGSYRRAIESDPGYDAGSDEAFAQAVTLRPQFVDAWCNRGLMYLRRGRHGAALDAFRAALRASPDAASAWNGIGAVLMETRRYEEARNAFVRSVEADPEFAEARYNLSFVLSNLGDFEGALRETKRAMELNPYYTTPRYKLAPELDAAERISGDHGVESFTFDDQALDQIFAELAPAPAAPAAPPPAADA